MSGERRKSSVRSDMMMEKIVASAAQLFAAKGYRATSVQDIADQLGMSNAGLYHYISGKEDLIEPVYIDLLRGGVEEIKAIISQNASPKQKLRIAIQNHIQLLSRNPALAGLSFEKGDDLPGNYARMLSDLRHEADNLLAGIIKEGVASGELYTAEPKIAALGIFGMCNWAQRWFRSDGKLSLNEVADVFLEMVMHGLERKPEVNNLQGYSESAKHLAAIRHHVEALNTLLDH